MPDRADLNFGDITNLQNVSDGVANPVTLRTYFKTSRLPVQFLIYIAITALSRHLVIDVQKVSDEFHLYLLLSITAAIALLSVAILILSYTAKHYGCPEDSELKDEK